MDPISLVGFCISLARDLYSLKQNIKSDDIACTDFFQRLKSLESPLIQLEKTLRRNSQNSRASALNDVKSALESIKKIIAERVENQQSMVGRVLIAADAYLNKFHSCLSDLNVHLDRCIAALQLAVSIDSTAAILDSTSAIHDSLDSLAKSLQMQTLSSSIESQFVKDPLPDDEDDERSVIGQGSFGITHRMINLVDKGVYAVKQIKVRQAKSIGVTEDVMRQEAAVLQQLLHPHIVRYFTSFFNKKGTVFSVVMELITGGSLADKIVEESVSVDQTMTWLKQMACVLEYLHVEMKILHRDIKPENVMLTADGKCIKLIDLGTAVGIKSCASKMSKTGTLDYFSYEKAGGMVYDGRDDVWSAGCVFAELVTKSRLSSRGGAIYMFHDGVVNARRLQLIEDCIAVDVTLGCLIRHMLEPEQNNRVTSQQLGEMILHPELINAETKPAASDSGVKLYVEDCSDPPQDLVAQFQYYLAAAVKGSAEGQCQVAKCYHDGLGVAVDKIEAFKYFKMAADQGHASGQYHVGLCHDKGIGVSVNKALAFEYYKLSADQGHASGQFSTGVCYQSGSGVSVDKEEAFKYYKLSADQGSADGQNCTGMCYQNGIGVSVDKALAFKYFKLAADQGHTAGLNNTGLCYHHGRGVSVDRTVAFRYYRLAADRGYADG